MRAVVAVLGLLAVASPASADSGLDEIDLDSDVVMRVELPQLGAILERVGKWNVANGVAIGLARSAFEDATGVDPSTPDHWKKRGIDVAQPVWLALAVDNGPLEDRYNRLLRSDDWSAARLAKAPPAFWRLRVVVSVTDASRAISWLRSLASGASWSSRRRNPRRGVSFAHWKSLAVWMFVDAPRPDRLVIDVIRPAFGPALSPPPLPVVARASGPVARANRFGALKTSRAAAVLRQPGIAAWMRSRTVLTFGRAMVREFHVSSVAGHPKRRAQGPLESHPLCFDLGRAPITGPFEDAAIRAHLPAKQPLTIEASFGGDAALLAKTFVRADHALDAHRRKGTVAWVSIWNRGAAGVRALPRTRALSNWSEALRLLRQCAPQHVVGARLFAWPELSGLFFDELAALGPRAKIIAAAAAGASGSVARWHADPMRWIGVLEGTLPASAETIVRGSLTKVFGDSKTDGDVTRWGRGRLRPTIRAGRVSTTFGGDAGVRWLARSKLDAPVAWLQGNELAAAWIDLAASANALAVWEPSAAIVSGAGELRTRLFVRGDRVVLESKITQQ